MAKTVTVKLSAPITAHDKVISSLTFREPNYNDYIALSDPVILAQNADGSLFPVENGETIRQYVERCLIEVDPLLLGELPLADAIKIKRAITDFFADARETS
jgi:hypothetical protein